MSSDTHPHATRGSQMQARRSHSVTRRVSRQAEVMPSTHPILHVQGLVGERIDIYLEITLAGWHDSDRIPDQATRPRNCCFVRRYTAAHVYRAAIAGCEPVGSAEVDFGFHLH